ncbi:MAG: NADH-quinone oxidoreductase subunit L [Nitrososphaerota archaeon]|nr:NADH-quinone oxidoreductase subunit L [Nitrososphaerota archaeon]MDG6978667.1 NADH-quinone oxidoreductase subunit L [Nitrososphaerota archaeon]MDG7020411.1 NADH-quinone oxidoreductase subunit L [Nitrososphaerota archaeon]
MAAQIPSIYLWLVVIFPFVGALLTPAFSRIGGKARDYAAVGFTALSALFAFLLLVPVLEGQKISVYNSVIPTSVPWISELGIRMGVLYDPFTIIIVNVVTSIALLIMVYSLDYMKNEHGLTRYWFFMNFFLGNMLLIVLSDNLLALFIGWEGVGLCSYALIGFHYRDEAENWVGTPGQKALGEEQAYSPSHAGMKAFVMTRIGDMAMLIGLFLVFIYAHTFSFQALASSSAWATAMSNAGLLVPAALLLFGGAIGKSAQFPLQEWLPDAMSGPAPVSALIHAATMVNAGVVLVARIGPIFYFAMQTDPALVQPFFTTVAWIGAMTAFLMATQGMVGFELKKILAYSTASQIGYMMLALGVAGLSTNFAQGLSAGVFQLMSHAIFKACLFMAAGVLIHATGTKYANEMGGLRDKMKLTFIVFLIAAASLSGIPPFSGFWSKDSVLASAWSAGQWPLFAVGAITAGITAFYSFRLVGLVFFGKASDHMEGHHPHETGPLGWIPYAILGGMTVVIGVLAYPLNIYGALESAATTYLQGLFPAAGIQPAPVGFTFDAESAAIALAFVLVGLGAAYVIYLARRVEPSRIVGQTGVMHGLYRFLENRWYINAVYYRVFVDPLLAVSGWLLDAFELNGLERVNAGTAALWVYISRGGNWVDGSVVDRIAKAFAVDGESLSRAVRRVQTGVVERYALVFAAGLAVILLLYIFASGVVA